MRSVVHDDVLLARVVSRTRTLSPVNGLVERTKRHCARQMEVAAPVADVRNAVADFDNRRLGNMRDDFVLVTHASLPTVESETIPTIPLSQSGSVPRTVLSRQRLKAVNGGLTA
jgi:hypothetical protein